MSVSALPTHVEQGRPVTLTVEVRGTPIDGVAGPRLSEQAELLSRFDFVADELTGDVERTNVKVFRRAIFPKQQGEQTIPNLEWSYFDPEREQYVTLNSDPVPITVTAPAAGSFPTSTFEESAGEAEGSELTVLRGGIAPSYVDIDDVLASSALGLSSLQTGGMLLIPPFLCMIITLNTRHRSMLRADSGFARRRSAMRSGRASLRSALSQPDAIAQLQAIAAALTAYVSDRFNLPPGEITPGEIDDLLSSHDIDSETTASISKFMGDCDLIRFAPSATEPLAPKHAAANALDWMAKIERGSR
jgi:hypothetical protein